MVQCFLYNLDQYGDSKGQPSSRGGRPSSRGPPRSNDTRGGDR